MAGGVTTVLGVLLAMLIAGGTWLYVAGIMPPFPANAWAFNGALGLSALLALLGGRAPQA